MSFVLTEYDIFKHVVIREEEEDIQEVKSRAKQLLARLPINIFTNEYYILYKSIEQASKYGVALSYDNFHHMLLNNIDDLRKEKEVDLFTDGDYTEAERSEKIIDYCLTEFDILSEAEIEDVGSLTANIEFYVGTWAKEKAREISLNMIEIQDDGLKVGNTLYKGVEDSNVYYQRAFSVIRSLIDADANALSENIDTSVDTVEEIQEKLKDSSQGDTVTEFGITALDKYYKYHKGEIITIQAGTGVGKTRAANALVYNASKKGNKTLYISLEQKSNKVFPMQMARHILEKYGDYSDLDDKSIIQETYQYDRKPIIDGVLRDMKDGEHGKVRIEGRSIEADELYEYMVKVWEEGFHFDILVLDYIGLLETRGGNRYEKLTNAINMLKTECKSFKGVGFLGIIPNQLTPDAETKLANGDYDGMTKVGGSETQYISRASDYIYTLEQDEMMRQLNKMRFHVSKVRLGKIYETKVDSTVDLGKIFFMDDIDAEDEDDY